MELRDEDESIGSLIRRQRRASGRSQQDLVETLTAVSGDHSLTRETVSRWERGVRIPGRYWRNWLSEALRIPVEAVDRAAARASARRSLDRHSDDDMTVDDQFSFGTTVRANWPLARLVRPVPGFGIDWQLLLPAGDVLDGTTVAISLHPGRGNGAGVIHAELREDAPSERSVGHSPPILLVAAEEIAGRSRYYAFASREANPQPSHRRAAARTVKIPCAYELDDLSMGIIWASSNLDDALLSDDTALTQARRDLRPYEQLPGSAVSHEVVSDLTAISRRWLGSDFCARHILRNLASLSGVPLFWTCEQNGEEACSWLLFRHKYAYLEKTSHRLVDVSEPLVRAFCIPEAAVHSSAPFQRILLFLAAALMEATGIGVAVSSNSEYSTMEGFVLAPGKRAIVANWVRSDGLWLVDTTTRPSLMADFADAAGHVRSHSITAAATPRGRLQALAAYLELDWPWLAHRCGELGQRGCFGLVRTRSRLLSVTGLDTACRYVGQLQRRTVGS